LLVTKVKTEMMIHSNW